MFRVYNSIRLGSYQSSSTLTEKVENYNIKTKNMWWGKGNKTKLN